MSASAGRSPERKARKEGESALETTLILCYANTYPLRFCTLIVRLIMGGLVFALLLTEFKLIFLHKPSDLIM